MEEKVNKSINYLYILKSDEKRFEISLKTVIFSWVFNRDLKLFKYIYFLISYYIFLSKNPTKNPMCKNEKQVGKKKIRTHNKQNIE